MANRETKSKKNQKKKSKKKIEKIDKINKNKICAGAEDDMWMGKIVLTTLMRTIMGSG